MKLKKKGAAATLILAFFSSSVIGTGAAFAVDKVAFANVPTAAQTAGSVITLVVSLSEPIICPGSCTVTTLRLSSSDTTTASISQSELTWTAAQWAETRTVTVTVAQSLTYDSSPSVRFSGTVTSNSEFYRNYLASFALNVAAPIKPPSIPDPKQKSIVLELPVGPLSDTSTTKLIFKGKFVEEIRSVHFNGVALEEQFWSKTDTVITVTAPKTSLSKGSLQIYNGAVPLLFDGEFVVAKSNPISAASKRVKILCKGKKISRTIYGTSPVCPVGYSIIK